MGVATRAFVYHDKGRTVPAGGTRSERNVLSICHPPVGAVGGVAASPPAPPIATDGRKTQPSPRSAPGSGNRTKGSGGGGGGDENDYHTVGNNPLAGRAFNSLFPNSVVPRGGRMLPYRVMGADWAKQLSGVATFYGMRRAVVMEGDGLVTRVARRIGSGRYAWAMVGRKEPIPVEWAPFLPTPDPDDETLRHVFVDTSMLPPVAPVTGPVVGAR